MGAQDPRETDDTPRCSIVIRKNLQDQGTEYTNIKAYTYTSDVLQLGDPFSVTLANTEGQYAGKIAIGDTVELFLTDPNVNDGVKVPKLVGVVTRRISQSTPAGDMLTIQGADLGWHIVNNCAPLWFGLRGVRLSAFLDKVIDKSWGFNGVRSGNAANRRVKQGRQGAVEAVLFAAADVLPRIQIEVGETIAPRLIDYARRFKLLVNVSSDGWLQLFQPDYSTSTRYKFHYHKFEYPTRDLNNVEQATLEESIDEVYTDITCVGEVVLTPPTQDSTHPNEGKFRGRHTDDKALPFFRRLTFTDGEQLTKEKATARAKWRYQRGMFGAWVYTVTVKGHSGRIDKDSPTLFYEADTMAEAYDDINGVSGSVYVAAVTYNRDMSGGTTSQIRMHRPGLLSA